jgi:periplasmic protein CpxP/Spy
MKKLLFAAGVSIIGLSAAFAQQVKQSAPATTTQTATTNSGPREMRRTVTPEQAAQRRTDRLSEELSLSADQKKKVYDVFLKQSNENQGRLSHDGQVDNQLKSIFNDEQNKKYDAMKANRMQMMQQRMQSARSTELKSPTPVKK